eukprot:scaffold223417_cov33-Tisochrysis_lutea.AAC.2
MWDVGQGVGGPYGAPPMDTGPDATMRMALEKAGLALQGAPLQVRIRAPRSNLKVWSTAGRGNGLRAGLTGKGIRQTKGTWDTSTTKTVSGYR